MSTTRKARTKTSNIADIAVTVFLIAVWVLIWVFLPVKLIDWLIPPLQSYKYLIGIGSGVIGFFVGYWISRRLQQWFKDILGEGSS
jgi:hypothetical protein